MSTTVTLNPSVGEASHSHVKGKANAQDLDDDFAYGTSVASCSPAIRLGFIRKVYGILAAQLALTTVVCAMMMYVAPLRNLAIASSGGLVLLSTVATFASLLALMFKKDSYPTNLHLLAVFTFAESLLVGSVCAAYAKAGNGDLVVEALAITMAIFGGMTLYAFVSKRDFSFMGGALFACLLALVACSFINLIIGISGNKAPALAFLISWGGSVLFSLYILYDSTFITFFLSLSSFPTKNRKFCCIYVQMYDMLWHMTNHLHPTNFLPVSTSLFPFCLCKSLYNPIYSTSYIPHNLIHAQPH